MEKEQQMALSNQVSVKKKKEKATSGAPAVPSGRRTVSGVAVEELGRKERC